MKKIIQCILLASILISCDKDNEIEYEIQYPSFIIAGQTEGDGIKYVDFEPDEEMVYCGGTGKFCLNLDIDNDSIDDFELVYNAYGYLSINYTRYSKIEPLNKNNYVYPSEALSSDDRNYAEALISGDTINNNSFWSKSTYLYQYWRITQMYSNPDTIVTSESHKGYWFDNNDIYVGVKIVKDDKEFFGWIDMRNKTIRRYAITQPY